MKMDQLPTKTIEEVTQTLIDYRGKTPPKTTSGVKLITAKVIKEGFIQDGNHEYIAEEMYDSWMRRGLPKQWDILITTEAPLGEVAQIRTDEKIALAQRVILLRGNPDIINQRYYFHVLKSPIVQGRLKARATGTTVFGIKQKELRKVQIPLFSLPVQEKIGEILSAYDDLLANNNRRIALLEEAIHRLYREWFVHLCFPGHEHTPIVDGVPEGWEKRPIKTFVDLQSGFAFKGKTFDDSGKYGLVTIGNVKDGQFEPICKNRIPEIPEKMPEYCLLATGDILLSLTGNIGRTCLVFGSDYLLNQRVAKLVPIAPANRAFVYCFFRDSSTQKTLEQIATGVAQQNLSPVKTGKLAVMFPKETLLQSFTEFADPMIDQILILSQQNIVLAEARDSLLPRLMNGSLPV